MKSSEEILALAREQVYQELEERLMEASQRLPHRCRFNHRQPLDVRRTTEGERNPSFNTIAYAHGQTIGLCMLGAKKVDGQWVVPESDQEEAKWEGTICEDPIDAQRCPYFDPEQDKAAVLARFSEDLHNPDWVVENMPELATLLWVLDEQAPPKLTWLQRLLVFLRIVRVEPLQPKVDPAQLLPETSR